MQNVIDRSPYKSRFRVNGHIQDMRKFYRSIDILCAPSRTESFPMVQLEAGSMGIPIISTDVGGVGELIIDGYNGYKVQEGDVQMIVKNINSFLRDKSLIKRFGQNARNHIIENFSIRKNIKKLDTIYSTLV